VSWYVPGTALEAADNVSLEVTEPPEGGVAEVGLRVAETPDIVDETERETAELNPFIDVTDKVDVPDAPPCTIVTDDGLADTE